MKTISLIILFNLLFFNINATAQEWRLKKDKNGIKVYSRNSTKFKFDELKVVCEFEGRMSQLAAVILDVNSQKQWVYKTAKSELLKEVSATDLIYYTVIECPWPFENRDLAARMVLTQNPKNKVMTIVAKDVANYLPKRKNLVRLTYSSAIWTITPINPNRYKIEYVIQVDPGEGVPAWVLNLFATNAPYESFKNLKEIIKLPKYAAAKYSFIVD